MPPKPSFQGSPSRAEPQEQPQRVPALPGASPQLPHVCLSCVCPSPRAAASGETLPRAGTSSAAAPGSSVRDMEQKMALSQHKAASSHPPGAPAQLLPARDRRNWKLKPSCCLHSLDLSLLGAYKRDLPPRYSNNGVKTLYIQTKPLFLLPAGRFRAAGIRRGASRAV